MAFQCELCEKKFSYPSDKKRHQRTIHGHQNFQCTSCTSSFNRIDNYHRHVKVCRINKKCRYCEVIFPDKHVLELHLLSVHANQKYACTNCDQKFTRKENCLRHRSTCRPFDDNDIYNAEDQIIRAEMSNLKPSEIREWASENGLLNHRIVKPHLKIKIHKCRHCFRPFNTYADKSNHESGCQSRDPTPTPSKSRHENACQSRDQPSTSDPNITSTNRNDPVTYRCPVCGWEVPACRLKFHQLFASYLKILSIF